MEAIVLAGGLGTRLKSLGIDTPKPMLPVGFKPFLDFILSFLCQNSINKIILSVGYRWEKIKDYFGENYKNASIKYSIEDSPLGTGGAVKKALNFCENNDVWVINGDTFFEIDLMDMFHFHKKQNSFFTVAIKEMENFSRYGRVIVNNQNRIINFEEKKKFANGYLNGGGYLIDRNYFRGKSLPDQFSLEKDILEKVVDKEVLMAYLSNAYFIDIGVPQDYLKAQTDKTIFEKYE
jgi:D-glycero-alpha-D-manno-heptose 1-phosphate guanylyltransferase